LLIHKGINTPAQFTAVSAIGTLRMKRLSIYYYDGKAISLIT